jgi:SAM-dependent methyltransferase
MGIPSISEVANKVGSSLRERGFKGTIKKCLTQIEELRFDQRFNVDTAQAPGQSVHHTGESHPYFPTKIAIFREIFTRLRLPYEQFTFVDLGSGKGRVLLLASDLPFKQIIGVEFSPDLHEVAVRNIQNYRNPARRSKDIQSVCADATTYPLPDGNTVIFLFNPFKSSSVSRVLDNLGRSLQEHPREIYLVYNTAVHQSLMEQCGFLDALYVGRYYSIFRNKAAGEVRRAAWNSATSSSTTALVSQLSWSDL